MKRTLSDSTLRGPSDLKTLADRQMPSPLSSLESTDSEASDLTNRIDILQRACRYPNLKELCPMSFSEAIRVVRLDRKVRERTQVEEIIVFLESELATREKREAISLITSARYAQLLDGVRDAGSETPLTEILGLRLFETAKGTIEATALRSKEASEYAKEMDEADANIAMLDGVIEAIEKCMAGGFSQTCGADRLLRLLRQKGVDESDRQTIRSFLQDSQSPEYAPFRGQVIGILKAMHDEMSASTTEARAAEDAAITAFEDKAFTIQQTSGDRNCGGQRSDWRGSLIEQVVKSGMQRDVCHEKNPLLSGWHSPGWGPEVCPACGHNYPKSQPGVQWEFPVTIETLTGCHFPVQGLGKRRTSELPESPAEFIVEHPLADPFICDSCATILREGAKNRGLLTSGIELACPEEFRLMEEVRQKHGLWIGGRLDSLIKTFTIHFLFHIGVSSHQLRLAEDLIHSGFEDLEGRPRQPEMGRPSAIQNESQQTALRRSLKHLADWESQISHLAISISRARVLEVKAVLNHGTQVMLGGDN